MSETFGIFYRLYLTEHRSGIHSKEEVMTNILQDLRYGFRVLLKSPGFTALAVIALALGIGANTAVFSVAIAFLRKPIALPNLDRLVMLLSLPPGETVNFSSVSPADYLDWKAQSHSYEEIAVWKYNGMN